MDKFAQHIDKLIHKVLNEAAEEKATEVSEKLHGGQKKIDKNKNGKIDSEDFKLLRKKKDWRGASKPLYKGGEFVQVKGKCKRFPYCNQGDINALKIWENENLQNAIKTVSSKTGLGENTIKGILQYELGNISKKG